VSAIGSLVVYFSHSLGHFSLTDSINLPLAPLIFSFVALLLLSAPIAPYLLIVIDRYFFRRRVDTDHILVDATRRLQRLVESSELVRELRLLFAESLAPDRIVILLRANNRHGWICALDDTALSAQSLDGATLDAAWRLEDDQPGVLLLEAVAGQYQRDQQARAQVLRAAGFDLWLGLGRPNDKRGVALLGPRRSGEAYLANHFDFLEALAEIATIATEIIDLHRRHLSLERERQRDAHLARIAKLYAGLAHEIRTPLTTLSNLISMLPDRLDDADYRQLLVTLVPGEVARIGALAEKLRALAPGHTPQRPIDLQPILQNIVTLQQSPLKERALKISLISDPDLPMIAGDHDQLVQLFTNLIQNAIDASPAGGQIEVQARTEVSTIEVEVLDQGAGLSSEVQDRLFEPFLTTKPSGMGLGLSICREIADAHHARLTIENRADGRGVKAAVVFRLAAEASVRAAS
jgi:signal transduction histidine kinase